MRICSSFGLIIRSFLLFMCLLFTPKIRGVESKSLVTLGGISSSGSLFVVSLPFGTPPQSQVLLTLDLASSLSSVACTSNSSNPASFYPNASSTYHEEGKVRKCTGWASSGSSTLNCTYPAQDYLSLTQRTVYSLNKSLTPLLSHIATVPVPNVAFQCSLNSSISSSISALGTAAFGNGSLALPAQVAKHAGLARQFAYCLPGYVVFGSRPEGYVFQNFPSPPANYSMSGLLDRTPLSFDNKRGYAVSMVNITVGGEHVKLRRAIKLYISTTDPHTKLESSVFEKVQASFRQHIGYGNVSDGGALPVPAVPPFGTCFNATTPLLTNGAPNLFRWAELGHVQFFMKGGLAWSFFLTSLSGPTDRPDILCLGVVDAGPKQPSVLGTAQQEGKLVHFDLQKASLGMAQVDNVQFSPPFRYVNCNNFV